VKAHERAAIALKEAKSSRKPKTMKALAIDLNWSMSAVYRACETEPEIRRILKNNKNPPIRSLTVPRVKRQDVPMQPIIQQLYEAVNSSDMTYNRICEKAGMSEMFFRDVFRRGHLPRMQSVMAVLEVVGYKL
jgi:hypothetical protein